MMRLFCLFTVISGNIIGQNDKQEDTGFHGAVEALEDLINSEFPENPTVVMKKVQHLIEPIRDNNCDLFQDIVIGHFRELIRIIKSVVDVFVEILVKTNAAPMKTFINFGVVWVEQKFETGVNIVKNSNEICNLLGSLPPQVTDDILPVLLRFFKAWEHPHGCDDLVSAAKDAFIHLEDALKLGTDYLIHHLFQDNANYKPIVENVTQQTLNAAKKFIHTHIDQSLCKFAYEIHEEL